jgi:hypothetical protein
MPPGYLIDFATGAHHQDMQGLDSLTLHGGRPDLLLAQETELLGHLGERP